MNPEKPSREEIEARITALLLGELPAEEAKLLRWTLSQDAGLQKLHDELQSTIVLVHEAKKNTATAPAEATAPLKLSDERRQKLLAHFKTPRPKESFWIRRLEIPPLIPILAVVALIALIAAMLLPSLAAVKKRAQLSYGAKTAEHSGIANDMLVAEQSPAPTTVTVAPAPVIAPPPVSIALPPSTRSPDVTQADTLKSEAKLESVQAYFANTGSNHAVDTQPLTESPAPAPIPPGSLADSAIGGVESQQIVGYINIPLSTNVVVLGASAAGGMINSYQGNTSTGFSGGGGGGGTTFSKRTTLAYDNSDQPPAASDTLKDRFYGNIAGEAGAARVPLVGDVPVMGSLFNGSANASMPAPTAAPVAPGSSSVTYALGSAAETVTNGLDETRLADKTVSGALALNGDNRFISRNSFVADDNFDVSASSDASKAAGGRNRAAIDSATGLPGSPVLAEGDQQAYEAEKRKLLDMEETHKLLNLKIAANSIDAKIPTASMVQLIDPAVTNQKQTLWQSLWGEYASTAKIKVESDGGTLDGYAAPAASTLAYDPYFIQTTFEIMQSERVLGKVVDSLKLDEAWLDKNGGEKLTKNEAMEMLRSRLSLSPVKNTKLVTITVTSDKPEEAAQIANAVALAYQEYRVQNNEDTAAKGLEVLRQQYAGNEKQIQEEQAQLAGMEQKAVEKPVDQSDLPVRRPPANAPIPQPEILTSENNFSTFSLNVSDVSFQLAAASLERGQMPDAASIRSEEFINAFDYRDPEAAPGRPMAFTAERARYPFAQNRDLLRFSIKTAAAGRQAGRALNIVLLLDISGSMERADRVAIIHEALRVLAGQLQPQDTVSVVTFARTARLWADGIPGDKAGATLDKVGGITPEGGTNLEEAMRLAYETARRHYLANGMNRVVLLTDGAANLGNVDPDVLRQKVEAQRKQGIALDCFGIGFDGYDDEVMEQLSRNGDGRYAFINSPEEAGTEFAAKLAGALQVAASDVKVQVEFNPDRVISYRQIGYAKHQLTKEQFRDNSVLAAEIAAQEAGNALYTIETKPDGTGPIATVRVRYKVPGTTDYQEHSWEVAYEGKAPALEQASPAMRLAATASAFSEWLAGSPFAQEVTPDELLNYLSGVPEIYGADRRLKKLEWMIRQAKSLSGK